MREHKKEKFLLEFNTSGKYYVLREKLKKALFRIVVEKLRKEVTQTSFTPEEKDKFKAKVYAYLNEQIKSTLDFCINR